MLYVTMGISGSGKSTWCQNLIDTFPETYILWISPDQIRKELTGSVSDQSQNDKVFKLAYGRLKAALAADIDVIFDSTALRADTRKELLDMAEKVGVQATLIVFRDSMDPKKCLGRIEKDIENGADRADTRRPDITQRQSQSFAAQVKKIDSEPWYDIRYV